MVARTQLLRLGLALLCLPLLTTACQAQDPDPAPTAVLPTPDVPSAEPSATSSATPGTDPTQTDIDASVAVYSEGRRLAESMLVEGSDADVVESLSPYFSGSYLGYWEAEIAEFRRKDYRTSGAVDLTIVAARNYASSEDGVQLALLICSDYTDVSTEDGQGNSVRRGFDYAYDEIVMRRTADTSWRAESGRSEPLQRVEGSECEGGVSGVRQSGVRIVVSVSPTWATATA